MGVVLTKMEFHEPFPCVWTALSGKRALLVSGFQRNPLHNHFSSGDFRLAINYEEAEVLQKRPSGETNLHLQSPSANASRTLTSQIEKRAASRASTSQIKEAAASRSSTSQINQSSKSQKSTEWCVCGAKWCDANEEWFMFIDCMNWAARVVS